MPTQFNISFLCEDASYSVRCDGTENSPNLASDPFLIGMFSESDGAGRPGAGAAEAENLSEQGAGAAGGLHPQGTCFFSSLHNNGNERYIIVVNQRSIVRYGLLSVHAD